MAAATASLSVDNCESCVLCSSNHNRTRPSFCQCKHCSIPLCLDCMKEHHDELLQDVGEISHQYNELQQLLQTRQMMIVDETAKSIEDVNRYFETYINELRQTQQKIIGNIGKAKQDAQDHVHKLDSDLRSLGGEIQGLNKEGVFQMTKTKNLSTELNKIQQELSTYQATRTDNLFNTQPDFSIKFDCSPAEVEKPQSTIIEINETCQTDPQKPSFTTYTLNKHDQQSVLQKYSTNQPQKNVHFRDGANKQYSQKYTSYDVDRMASDGKNVLYTSYYDEGQDLIAYCLMYDDDGDADKWRDWKQSRIIDMIWWSGIGKFVCATENGVYTVDYANRRFKITNVIRGEWSYIRVAANTAHFFMWTNSTKNNFDGIEVFSTQFEHIRTIDFDKFQTGSIVDASSSFCVTENIVASICRRKKNNREVFQVTFYDLDMNKFNSVLLGNCNSNTEIRTDGKDRFFITIGCRRFYIVSSNGEKQTINLENDGNCITVLNHRRVAVSNPRNSMEILTY